MLKHYITNQIIKAFEAIEYGSVHITLPNGKSYDFAGHKPGAHGTFYCHDWRTATAFAMRGDIGLTDAYRNGWWDSDDLTSMLTVGLQNSEALDQFLFGSAFSRLAYRFLYMFRKNSLNGSKRNIHAHYDLGNEFYSLWLDPSMSYSSALFSSDDEPLETAQYNKYDRIINRLDKTSGRLLEVGCGWGGFAERAMVNRDYDIKGITLSEEQHDYANKRLQNKAEIVLEDYRHQNGKYDNIVSIEMFEAVGEKFWPTYFQKMKSLLSGKGKAVVQTITVEDTLFERYRTCGDMIRTYIFPGGMLPSPSRFQEEAEKADLRLTDRFDFGQDYATTLQHWLKAFESRLPQVRELGFDEPFIRVWRFYLAGCIASFLTKKTDVMQVELQHA